MNKNRKQELKGKSGVYKITCLTNGRFYIGSSKDLRKRLIEHKSHLKHNHNSNKSLQNDYNVYSSDSFKFEVIEYCNEDIRKDREQIYLDFYKNDDRFYNKAKDAKASMKGMKHTEESLDKMRKNHRDISGENNPNYGKHLSDETKRKMLESRKRNNYKVSDETKQKISEGKKGKNNPRARRTYMYDRDYNLINIFDTAIQCAEYLFVNGIVITQSKNPINSIRTSVVGHIKNNTLYQGYVFSYEPLDESKVS